MTSPVTTATTNMESCIPTRGDSSRLDSRMRSLRVAEPTAATGLAPRAPADDSTRRLPLDLLCSILTLEGKTLVLELGRPFHLLAECLLVATRELVEGTPSVCPTTSRPSRRASTAGTESTTTAATSRSSSASSWSTGRARTTPAERREAPLARRLSCIQPFDSLRARTLSTVHPTG